MTQAASQRLGRRAVLSAALGSCVGWASARALAMGRVPVSGSVRLRLPWSTRSLDPHDLLDPMAAFFASAIADGVYGIDRKGRPYPTLARGMPTVEAGQTVVELRQSLRSARGRSLSGRDLVWSLRRASRMGGAGVLGELPTLPQVDRRNPSKVRFGAIDPVVLALRLASPLAALLPRGFSARQPDGTGAFIAHCSSSRMVLRRSPFAARGPSFLDQITIRSAPDLVASLRAFEAGRDDVGWLGLGLHRDRPGARRFDFGEAGWVVLATGEQAARFGSPGMAQKLADRVPIERLRHLGLGRRGKVKGGVPWGGAPAAILVDREAPQLRAVADAVAAHLSRANHDLTVSAVASSQLRRALGSGDFALAVHAVRPAGPGPLGALLALATADRPSLGRDLGRHPPKLAPSTRPRALTRTLRLGVLGGLTVSGGAIAQLKLAPALPARSGLDWSNSFRRP